ncbi:hypothetical protein DIS24_g8269 [Lasiodiplodia hormozganensis]|uniref:Transcriptional regulator n=1 Tax=Lasiodiplodia hormozganensis TaxID=869390 RepID=A0AA39Y2Y5_9PEZI|nr:hypothetical protein DIS24_g8269 [Lasiodiplodia hormozganensis]
MSDSDAEPVPAIAPDAEIERALRSAVRDLWLSGDHQNLTLRRVRKSVEDRLSLPDCFLKNDPAWKGRSENIITDQVSVQEREEPAEPEAPRAKAPKPAAAAAPQKRKPSTKKANSTSKPKARKRQKTANSSDEEEALHSDATKSPEPAPKRLAKKPRVVEDDSDDQGDTSPAPRPSSSHEGSSQPTSAHVGNGKSISSTKEAKASDSDSDMSVLIDEPPKKKQQKRGTSAKGSKPTTSKSKTKDAKEIDPHEAEIKRLKDWLLKCGVRKVWGKELKPFETPKAKINHLKEMLKDVGMEGRYSIEKARQIKERRELAADLEAVQEGAKRWGHSESDEDNGDRPRRRLAKGLKDLEGLIESNGEESD